MNPIERARQWEIASWEQLPAISEKKWEPNAYNHKEMSSANTLREPSSGSFPIYVSVEVIAQPAPWLQPCEDLNGQQSLAKLTLDSWNYEIGSVCSFKLTRFVVICNNHLRKSIQALNINFHFTYLYVQMVAHIISVENLLDKKLTLPKVIYSVIWLEFTRSFFELRKTSLNLLNRKRDAFYDLIYEYNNCISSFHLLIWSQEFLSLSQKYFKNYTMWKIYDLWTLGKTRTLLSKFKDPYFD